jgi:hypothetical protein
MSNRNVKVYKNSDRETPDVAKKYVPQYQLRGIEPEEFASAVVPDHVLIKQSTTKLPPTNPRAPRPPIRQPYAKVIPSPVGRGRGPVPNVGNNMEHTWSSVDGELIDDLSDDSSFQHEMIDNNEFVTDQALGFSTNHVEKVPQPTKPFMTEKDLQEVIKDTDLSTLSRANIEDDEHILLVNGVIFAFGPLSVIQEETRALIFGEHEICDGNPVPVEDLLVLKKVKIKIGVFLD